MSPDKSAKTNVLTPGGVRDVIKKNMRKVGYGKSRVNLA
jgi:hypothetical protein